MLQLHNTSPFVPMIFATPDRRGVDTLVVLIKATFVLGSPLELAEDPRPITLADEYWAPDGSLRYPSEVHLAKPGTDVIVVADACAPRAQAVTELDVQVRVGARTKRLRVYGDRAWYDGGRHLQPCRPQPFVRVPMVWERAFGGRSVPDLETGTCLAEPRNPVGVGFLAGRRPEAMIGLPVPNIEDPDDPLLWLGQAPQPAGFAALAPTWEPRIRYAGTYDARWRKQRAPFLPEDFDPRFFCSAAPGLSFEPGLAGGELLGLRGFDPDRDWQFALPRCQLEVRARVAGSSHGMDPALDTVLVDVNEARLSLTWRASLAVEDQLLRVSRVDVGLVQLEGALEAGARA